MQSVSSEGTPSEGRARQGLAQVCEPSRHSMNAGWMYNILSSSIENEISAAYCHEVTL